MAWLRGEPILLRDLPNDAMYVGREWWEFMRDQDNKLHALQASLRSVIRDIESQNLDSLGRTLTALREIAAHE